MLLLAKSSGNWRVEVIKPKNSPLQNLRLLPPFTSSKAALGFIFAFTGETDKTRTQSVSTSFLFFFCTYFRRPSPGARSFCISRLPQAEPSPLTLCPVLPLFVPTIPLSLRVRPLLA